MNSIHRVAIVGAGTMGNGIAQVCAQSGKSVVLVDPYYDALELAREKIEKNVELLIANGMLAEGIGMEVLRGIEFTQKMEVAADAEIVIEAIPEQFHLKQKLFAKLSDICSQDCIFASNTSGTPITQIAGMATHPERVLGTHFFQPAHLIPLVEIIQTEYTDETVIEKTVDFITSIGKTPARVKRDIPGFVANRLQHALAREAMSLVQKGIVSSEDLDTIVKESFALRMIFTGPIQQRDMNGLDTHIFVNEYLYPDLEDTKEPLAIIKNKVAADELGVKTGKGFYDWAGQSPVEVYNTKNQELVSLLKFLKKQ